MNHPLRISRQSQLRRPDPVIASYRLSAVFGNSKRFDPEGFELRARTAQLGDVPAAERSPNVPQEHEEDWRSPEVVLERHRSCFRHEWQRKVRRCLPRLQWRSRACHRYRHVSPCELVFRDELRSWTVAGGGARLGIIAEEGEDTNRTARRILEADDPPRPCLLWLRGLDMLNATRNRTFSGLTWFGSYLVSKLGLPGTSRLDPGDP